jgi:hypothetical protein
VSASFWSALGVQKEKSAEAPPESVRNCNDKIYSLCMISKLDFRPFTFCARAAFSFLCEGCMKLVLQAEYDGASARRDTALRRACAHSEHSRRAWEP